jgi:hypothetical protein
VKFKNVGKFPDKLLVWIAFSLRGFAKPFFMPFWGAINAYSDKEGNSKLNRRFA